MTKGSDCLFGIDTISWNDLRRLDQSAAFDLIEAAPTDVVWTSPQDRKRLEAAASSERGKRVVSLEE